MTSDYDSGLSPEQILKRVIKGAGPGGIPDLHDGKNLNDGIDRSSTIRALPIIIDTLKKEGYTFVSLPDLLKIPAYRLSESPQTSAKEVPPDARSIGRGEVVP